MAVGLTCCGLGLLFIQNYLLQKDVSRKPAFKKSLRLISKHLGEPVRSSNVNSFVQERERFREVINYSISTDNLEADVHCVISIRDLNRILELTVTPKPNGPPISILTPDQ